MNDRCSKCGSTPVRLPRAVGNRRLCEFCAEVLLPLERLVGIGNRDLLAVVACGVNYLENSLLRYLNDPSAAHDDFAALKRRR